MADGAAVTATVTAQSGPERLTRTVPMDDVADEVTAVLDATGASFAVVEADGQAYVMGADGVRYGPIHAPGLAGWLPAAPRPAPVRHLRLVPGGAA